MAQKRSGKDQNRKMDAGNVTTELIKKMICLLENIPQVTNIINQTSQNNQPNLLVKKLT